MDPDEPPTTPPLDPADAIALVALAAATLTALASGLLAPTPWRWTLGFAGATFIFLVSAVLIGWSDNDGDETE